MSKKNLKKSMIFGKKSIIFIRPRVFRGIPLGSLNETLNRSPEAQKGDNSFSNLSDLSGQITQGQEDLFDKNGAQRPIPIYEPPTDKQPSDGLGVVASRNRLIPLTS